MCKKIWILIPIVTLALVAPAQAVIAPVELNKTPKIAPKTDLIMEAVIRCESGANQNAVGKAGEIGILQYMPSTWKEWTIKMNRPDLDINKSEDQIVVYQWAAKNNLLNHWTCWRKLFAAK